MYNVLKTEVKECTLYEDEICLLPCTKCNACFHDYTCNCQDNSIRNNMCKHIHAIGMNLLSQEQTSNVEKERKGKVHTDTEQTNMTYKEDDPIETTHKHKENNLHHNYGNITNLFKIL